MELSEKLKSSEIIYEGKFLGLRIDSVELPDGSEATREIISRPGAVCVAAVTENDEILFVRQFRTALSKVLLELPAGKLDPGEDPLEAAKRELSEETGAVGTNFKFLGPCYPSPGYTNEIISLYSCDVLSLGPPKPDKDEFVSTELIKISDALETVTRGEIPDLKTQAGILRLSRLLKRD